LFADGGEGSGGDGNQFGGIDFPAAVGSGVSAVGDLRAEVCDLPAVEAEQERASGGTTDVEGENAIQVSVVARTRKMRLTPFSAVAGGRRFRKSMKHQGDWLTAVNASDPFLPLGNFRVRTI
jgi:hypothetical protein